MTICESPNQQSVEELFHWNNKPEDRTKTCEEIRDDIIAKVTEPSGIIDFFVLLFQDYFADPNNIVSDNLRNLIMSKSIVVSSLANFDTSKSGAKPCIYVEFGGMKNQADFAKNNQFDYNSKNGSKMYYTRWQMGFTFHVLGNTLKETLMLSEEVCRVCHHYQEPIQDATRWLTFQVSEMQKVQALSENGNPEGYISSISVLLITHCAWHLFDSSPKLKRVIMSLVNENSSLEEGDY